MAEKEKRETFTERALKRTRSDGSPAVRKKRSLSRIIMIVDALILLAVLFFLNTRESSKNEYASSHVSISGLNLRFSMNAEESGIYIFSITLLSSGDSEKTWNFDGALAFLKLRAGGAVFYEDEFGKNISKISMLPGEAKTFPLRIPSEIIDRYMAERTNVTKRKKTLLDLILRSGETIEAETVLNLPNKISTFISFEHEAKE